MTMALDSLPMGHWVEFKGPVGKFEYLGRGRCAVGGKERRVRRFVMVCGGSGVTPIYAVLRAVMRDDPADTENRTECVVVDGNRTEEDILCRTELDALVEAGNGRCRVMHTLTKPGERWTGRKGRMDRALLEEAVGSKPREGGEEMVLICGPPAMEESARASFLAMGWKAENMLFF